MRSYSEAVKADVRRRMSSPRRQSTQRLPAVDVQLIPTIWNCCDCPVSIPKGSQPDDGHAELVETLEALKVVKRQVVRGQSAMAWSRSHVQKDWRL